MATPQTLVRAHTSSGCIAALAGPEGGSGGAPVISASVGHLGVNRPGDVTAIQDALNRVPAQLGGSAGALAVDGIAGPKTRGAITTFQTHHFGAARADGRVDVAHRTIARLRELNGVVDGYSLDAVVRWATRRTTRLLRARFGAVEARQAITKGLLRIDDAGRHVRGLPDFTGMSARSYRLVDTYFAFGKMSAERVNAALRRIHGSFVAVRIALDGAGLPNLPAGSDIFQIDPANRPWGAYSPRRSVKQPDGIDPYYVYLCDGADELSPDLFNHVMLHELFHLTDDETPADEIVDKGYREKAMKLPHAQRMHNADNFALFATHCHIGRARLVASQPAVAPHVPADLP